MYKKLVTIFGVVLVLCFATALAQQKTLSQANTESGINAGVFEKTLPDLTITSAQITSAPFQIGSNVLVPLEIDIANIGTGDVIEKFIVHAWGKATDGNVHGNCLGGSGEVEMDGDIVLNGLAAGSQKTINGFLMLVPLSQPPRLGSKYQVVVEVDGAGDADYYWYEAIHESNEDNNDLTIYYPLSPFEGRFLGTGASPSYPSSR
jgi:hypothetical protein